MKMRNFAVIGLGRFGAAIARFLEEEGGEVLAIDSNPEIVRELEHDYTSVVEADATDIEILSNLGVGDVDAAIVSIGTNMEAGIMITLLLKELKVPLIIAKVRSKLHEKVLKKVGVNLVVYPEEDAAHHLAKKLYWPGYSELEMTAGLSLLEISAPKSFVGRTVSKLKLREKYNINVVAIKRKNPIIDENNQTDYEEKIIAPPKAEEKFETGDRIVFVCPDEKVDKFKDMK